MNFYSLYYALVMGGSGGGGGGTPRGVFVGYVRPDGTLPTTRLDGSPLQNEDFVRPDPNIPKDQYPFNVGSLEFRTRTDKGLYMVGRWYVEAGAIQDTSETPSLEPNKESISGDAKTQYAINCEFVKAINGFVYKQETPSKTWRIVHNFNNLHPASISFYDKADNHQFFGGVYIPIDENIGEIQFNNLVSGTAILKF